MSTELIEQTIYTAIFRDINALCKSWFNCIEIMPSIMPLKDDRLARLMYNWSTIFINLGSNCGIATTKIVQLLKELVLI